MKTNLSGGEAPAQDNADSAGTPSEPLNRSPSGQVGYGKPPVQHQFQRRRSGNPGGRPKKATSVAAVFEQELDTSIRIAGRPMSPRVAMFHVGVDKALTEDMFAMGRVFKWLESYELLTASSATASTGGVIRLPRAYRHASQEEQSRIMAQAFADAQKKHAASGMGGRANSHLNMRAALSGILAQRTMIDIDGVPTSMAKRDALMKILARNAAAGNGRAADLVVNVEKKIARAEQQQQKHGPRGFLIVTEPCKTGEEWERDHGASARGVHGSGIDSADL